MTKPPGPSLLRWSAAERLALAALLIAGLWGAVFWSLSGSVLPGVTGRSTVMEGKGL